MKPFVFSLIAAILLISCNKEESQVLGTVSGILTVEDENLPEITSPLEGIKVYLVDAELVSDLADTDLNISAILDSTLTDSKGKYSFSSIIEGNYYIIPFAAKPFYKFEAVSGSEANKFTIDSKNREYTIDFSAPDPTPENGSQFRVSLNFSNLNDSYNGESRFSYSVYRRYYNFFSSNYNLASDNNVFFRVFYYSSIQVVEIDHLLNNGHSFDYGYYGLNTLTNTLRIDCFKNGNFEFSFYIDYPISGCPEESAWNIDWSSRTASRVS